MKKQLLMLIAALSMSVNMVGQSGNDANTIVETPHISAYEGAFAKTVLMPGDPLRAQFIAENFLEDAQLITSVRNMLGYTGTYKGVRVSVMGSGMGMPSIGIYSWELYSIFGVENIIRVGSAGSYNENLDLMSVTLAESSVTGSTYAFTQNGQTAKTLQPDQELNQAIMQKATELGIDLKTSKVYCCDAYYSEEPWQSIAEHTGADCVDMESFALFHNAQVLGKRAASLLTISNSFVNSNELTPEERQLSFTEMIRLALETAVSSSVTGVNEISAKGNGDKANGKYVENSQVVIVKDGKKYNVAGSVIEQ